MAKKKTSYTVYAFDLDQLEPLEDTFVCSNEEDAVLAFRESLTEDQDVRIIAVFLGFPENLYIPEKDPFVEDDDDFEDDEEEEYEDDDEEDDEFDDDDE
jgi:hypothetical protein